MKFTSLTTIVISATAMAGVAIAQGLLYDTASPGGLPCNPNDSVQCSTDLQGFNDEKDYGFFCGPDWTILSWTPCSCKNCCMVVADGDDFQCGY
ncbi:hypothetical protein DFJ58DRAFT_249421 [Suillus subalutaceus]|uniref:uncharacterized protein n=1 Tax=Suillus subalutaceus TaxID=48586 RepID=UPI001B8783D8|nr:uncharacterized protein DFJ58DRAFT_249421 [Suillus subalutaceus]KAG1831426.1 hypothetical protein DFJ58DRAFT_249421 [Suillus subalutaceus]